MKLVLGYLKRFWSKDFHPAVYGIVLATVAVAIVLNYQYDFEDSFIDLQQRKPWGWPTYWVYFATPYFFVIALYHLFLKDFKLSNRFWLKSIFAITLLSLKVWFFHHTKLIPSDLAYQDRYLAYKISNSVVNVLIYTIGLVFFYKFFEVGNKNWYGLGKKENHWMVFAGLLAVMLPLIFIASFQPDFLESYPRLKVNVVKEDYWQWFSLYEPFYLGEFVTLEWFFRGFLVVGMVKLLGHRAVLPMAVLYCIFHFGKPMGECIGSLFGGYILGVVAYYSRSVWGGIIVHMGVAFFMDAFALMSHFIWMR